MHQKVQSIKYTSIRHLIYSRLIKILSICTEKQQLECITEEDFPLYKDRYYHRILYTSGVVLRLSKYENISAQETAEAIASHFLATYDNEFKVQTISPGWIQFQLTAPALATWLQSLIEGKPLRGSQKSKVKSQKLGSREQGEYGRQGEQGERERVRAGIETSLFTVQYAHARCCSLLRLGEQEGLINSPNVIPWLDCNQELRLTHPASTGLISELVQVVDIIECNNLAKWEKAALKLSQAFEKFWSKCLIFGEVKTSSPDLAAARLGLVMATQSVLSFLLETKFGISAPEEL